MEYSSLLAPLVALVAWTLVIMAWMAVTRLPAMKRAGIDVFKLVGGRGQNLEGVIPDQVQCRTIIPTCLSSRQFSMRSC